MDSSRDYYLLPVMFNTLSLLFLNRIMRTVFYIKLHLSTGFDLRIVEAVILSITVLLSILYLAIHRFRRIIRYTDLLVLFLTVISIFNLLTFVTLYSLIGE